MTPRQIADACRACPLGAAMEGHPRRPFWDRAAKSLGIRIGEALDVVIAWDNGRRTRAARFALAAGLGPRIEAFLRGEART